MGFLEATGSAKMLLDDSYELIMKLLRSAVLV